MSQLTQLAFGEDEMEILIEALEADLEDYVEAAQEAREAGQPDEGDEFAAAAENVQALLQKVLDAAGITLDS